MYINFNHFESFSTVDYSNRVCCVVFLNGCNFKCSQCHNKQTWVENNFISIYEVRNKILELKPLIHTVVFSGGEPTFQLSPLLVLCKLLKGDGFTIGIETNGYYTKNIIKLSPFVDMFFVDVKAPLNDGGEYFKNTKSVWSCQNVKRTLETDLPIEVRVVNFNKEYTKKIVDSITTNQKITILKLNEKVK